VRAWRHAANFDPRKGTVEAWVLTITRNASVDALRRRRSIPTDPEVLVAMCRLDVEGPDHRVTQSDEARRVAAMVQGLPEEQRRAVLLAALQGRTAQDISEIEGIPLGTAKTRIRTGLIRVRQMMEGAA
jgi:RNA polymerase sigma-70 factor (ECF subfamily)